jgi:hypothetical protein
VLISGKKGRRKSGQLMDYRNIKRPTGHWLTALKNSLSLSWEPITLKFKKADLKKRAEF